MQSEKYNLSPPSLEDLVKILKASFEANYAQSSVSVVTCPDLRQAPFHLATQGLSGDEKVADVGGQPNLFPRPRLDKKWSLVDIARAMDMKPEKGSLVGAGAGPFHHVGQNSELCPNLRWEGGFESIESNSQVAEIDPTSGKPNVRKSPSCDCALMINLFGSLGEPGPVLKITARKRVGSHKSFTECIRQGIAAQYGDSQTISLGGTFLLKSGRANFHIMPDFPSEDRLPFRDREQLNRWLTYHEFDAPLVCCTVLHSADPGQKLGLRMEHTHCFAPDGKNAGGHYHHDVEGDEDVEYEAYFNTAQVLYRVERPTATLKQDLHD